MTFDPLSLAAGILTGVPLTIGWQHWRTNRTHWRTARHTRDRLLTGTYVIDHDRPVDVHPSDFVTLPMPTAHDAPPRLGLEPAQPDRT